MSQNLAETFAFKLLQVFSSSILLQPITLERHMEFYIYNVLAAVRQLRRGMIFHDGTISHCFTTHLAYWLLSIPMPHTVFIILF